MAKSKSVPNVKVGYRVNVLVAEAVSGLAKQCDWTESKAASFLIDVGSAAVNSSDPAKLRVVVDDAKGTMAAAMALATAQAKAAAIVAGAKSEYAAAERKRKGEPDAPKVLESVPNTAKAVRKAAKATGPKVTTAPTPVATSTPPDVEGQKNLTEIVKP